jgi:hypothetical protein
MNKSGMMKLGVVVYGTWGEGEEQVSVEGFGAENFWKVLA